MSRNVTAEERDPRERYSLYRLCDCIACQGSGKAIPVGKCTFCRGEGKQRQELATCESPEAVGVALVTLAREGEFEECPIGLLDREGEKGKKWLILPWLPCARNVTDAARSWRRASRYTVIHSPQREERHVRER